MPIGKKLNEIYGDLESNVTRIYNRQPLHLAFDLVFHSVLAFNLGFEHVKKGYTEALILGDTRCGKTTVANALCKHYGLGEAVSGESAKYTGLVGGLDQIKGSWQIKWGKIPLNHRRLLIIDEVSGLPIEDIEKMSQIRSDGFVEITKIRNEKTNAKTRLIWMSNPRDNRSINSYAYGPPLIESVIGKPEDIARFDFALIVEKNDVDYDIIDNHVLNEVETPHIYTSGLCHDLVLWAWSRNPKQIHLSKETVQSCIYFGKKMCEKYSDECPIVNKSEQKKKLARLATALACRLFSTKDGENVIVQPDHVQFIFDYLNAEYDKPFFQYDEWSLDKRADNLEMSIELARVLQAIGIDGARTILRREYVRGYDINNALGGNKKELSENYFALLLKLGALRLFFSNYEKTPGFVTILKQFIKDPNIIRKYTI